MLQSGSKSQKYGHMERIIKYNKNTLQPSLPSIGYGHSYCSIGSSSPRSGSSSPTPTTTTKPHP
jgi:hypothetical protein